MSDIPALRLELANLKARLRWHSFATNLGDLLIYLMIKRHLRLTDEYYRQKEGTNE